MDPDHAGGSRFERASRGGHYESWFVRANHPERPLAFWARYTVFAPKGRPGDATAEMWGVWFDGERNEVFAARDDVPLAESFFGRRGVHVQVGASELTDRRAVGSAEIKPGGPCVAWNLSLGGGIGPLSFLPEPLNLTPFPTAKSIILERDVRFDGTFEAGGNAHEIAGWIGSLNHNWGSRHTDEYAWSQVVGFDDAPGSFFECLTGRVVLVPRIGLRSPWVTVAVLHLDGRTHRMLSLHSGLSGHAPYTVGESSFVAHGLGISVEGETRAPREHFVGLRYRNPPGGTKICHNTKIASATLRVRERGTERTLVSRSRAAFEVLADRPADGVVIAG